MDPQLTEISYNKGQSSSIDQVKKKKYVRKKDTLKPAKLMQEFSESAYPELNSELNSDLIHYTFKLEYELAATKKKLKHQRKKFRNMIHSLAKYFDAKGITSQMIDDYVKLIGAQGSDDSESESDYQKLFTTHKYQLVEDNTPYTSTITPVVPVIKQPVLKSTPSYPEMISNTPSSSSIPTESTHMPPPQPEKKRGRPSQKDKEKTMEKEKVKKETDSPDNGDGKKKRKSKKKDEEAPTKAPTPQPVQASNNSYSLPSGLASFPKLDSLTMSSLISPAKEMDKVKKVEDLISNYEDFAQGRSSDSLRGMTNPAMKNIPNPMQNMSYPSVTGGFGDYNKILQELLKMGNPSNILGDKLQPPGSNFYNNNYK